MWISIFLSLSLYLYIYIYIYLCIYIYIYVHIYIYIYIYITIVLSGRAGARRPLSSRPSPTPRSRCSSRWPTGRGPHRDGRAFAGGRINNSATYFKRFCYLGGGRGGAPAFCGGCFLGPADRGAPVAGCYHNGSSNTNTNTHNTNDSNKHNLSNTSTIN